MMKTWKRFMLWLSMTSFGEWMTKRISSRIDPAIFRISGGRFTSIGPVVIPQLVLTTTGRRSSRKRDAQLDMLSDAESGTKLLTKQDVKHRLDANHTQIKDMSETVHSLLTIFSNYLTDSEARRRIFAHLSN